MNLLDRITVDPSVHHGVPCIRKTRTPVFVILEALSMGLSIEKVKSEYPPLTDEDIKACLAFASLLAKEEEVPLTISK